MRALRPYLLVGAAIVGAGVIVVAPTAPPLPDIEVPAIQPTNSEVGGFSPQDLLGVLANIEGAITVGGLNPPNLGPLDLGKLDLGGLDLGTVPGPSNP